MTARDRRTRGSDATLVLERARGRTWAEAAAAAGMSESTARRRGRRDGFDAEVGAQREAIIRQATDQLAAALTEAVTTLSTEMTAGDSSAARVSAARTVLAQGLRWREALDLEARLAAIEHELGIHTDRQETTP